MTPIVLLFSSITLCFGNNSLSLFQVHFSKLIEKGDEIILYFYGDIPPFTNHNNGHFIQQIILTTNYSKRLWYRFHRHLNPSNVIITSYLQAYKVKTQTAFWTLNNLFMVTDTVILYIERNSRVKIKNKDCRNKYTSKKFCDKYQQIINTPSFKAVLTFSRSNVLIETTLISNDYSPHHTNLLNASLSIILKLNKSDILNLHKSKFWNANGKKIPMHISYSNFQFMIESRSQNFSCDRAYKSRKYKLMDQASFCWAKQMLAGELSKTHNITYIPKKYGSIILQNLIIQDKRSKEFNASWFEGMYLQYYSGWSYHYCVNTKERNKTFNLGYDTWIRPMDVNSWSMMITTWFTVALFYTFNLKWTGIMALIYNIISKLLETFYVLSCSGINGKRKGCMFTLLTLSSFLFWELYQNEITGLTIVEDTVKQFETVCEFLASGFQINHRPKNTILCESYNTSLNKFYNPVGTFKEKVGWQKQARWNLWYRFEHSAKYIPILGAEYKCLYVQEEFDVLPWFLVILTNNRHWIMQTVERIHEGGFMSKWNDLAFHAEINQNKAKFLEPATERIADSIKRNELWSIVLLCLLIHCISIIVLGLEQIVKICKMSFGERLLCWRRFKAPWDRFYSFLAMHILNIWRIVAGIKP